MIEYFLLSYRVLNRKITSFGVPAIVGYIVVTVVFVLLSSFLFSKTDYAAYIYVSAALFLVFKLSEFKRNDFLKSVFNKKSYLQLRSIENIICTLPFFAFLIYKEQFIFAALLEVFSILLSVFNFKIDVNFTLPTPFGKKPFEFTMGFRRAFFVFPIAYLLTIISILVDNFNLGVSSLILIALVCLSFYSKPENEYFVWSFCASPKGFLLEKIKIGLTNFTLLSLPVLIALTIFFSENTLVLLGVLLLCCVYLFTIILAKYSAYPDDIGLSEGILFGLGFIIPPLLVMVIPFFYIRSIKSLNEFLDD